MVKRSEVGDLGGGSLEHLRLWLRSQWPGLALGVPSRSERQTHTEKAQEPSWGSAKGGTLTVLRHHHSAALEAGGSTGPNAWHSALAQKAKAAQPWKI